MRTTRNDDPKENAYLVKVDTVTSDIYPVTLHVT